MGRTVLGTGDATPARWSRVGSPTSAEVGIPFQNRKAILNLSVHPKRFAFREPLFFPAYCF